MPSCVSGRSIFWTSHAARKTNENESNESNEHAIPSASFGTAFSRSIPDDSSQSILDTLLLFLFPYLQSILCLSQGRDIRIVVLRAEGSMFCAACLAVAVQRCINCQRAVHMMSMSLTVPRDHVFLILPFARLVATRSISLMLWPCQRERTARLAKKDNGCIWLPNVAQCFHKLRLVWLLMEKRNLLGGGPSARVSADDWPLIIFNAPGCDWLHEVPFLVPEPPTIYLHQSDSFRSIQILHFGIVL